MSMDERLIEQLQRDLMEKTRGNPPRGLMDMLEAARRDSRRGLSRGDFMDAISFSFADMPSNPVTQSRGELREAQEKIKELSEILERVQKEPLVLYKIDRMSKDNKNAYVKKGEQDIRIEAPKGLKSGDEVLLHPKTFQIVENLGRPPLEVSQFAPAEVPDVSWDDIGGLEDAKADLIEAIEMPHQNKELFEFYGKKQIKGILLAGPPGCGKTMLGKAAASSLAKIYGKKESKTGFLYVKGPEILNQYVGQTEQTIRDMFADARQHKVENGYPAIIFLDEADAILATRGTRNVGIGNTIVPMFLTEMDGLEESGAIVIIATNRPDVLDPAVVRDGRIDRKITVSRPSLENAKYILALNLKKTKVHKAEKVEKLAEEMAALIYSDDCKINDSTLLREIVNGAMLANCVHLAISAAIRRDMKNATKSGVTMDDIIHGVARIRKQSDGVQHELPPAPTLVAVMIGGGNGEAEAPAPVTNRVIN